MEIADSAAKHAPIRRIPEGRTLAPHYPHRCQNCRKLIWIPETIIARIIGSPLRGTILVPGVLVVCPRCWQVQLVQMRRISGQTDKGKMKIRQLAVETDACDWLYCEVDGCTPRLPLFPMWTSGAQRPGSDPRNWRWQGARCPQGHPIPGSPQTRIHPSEGHGPAPGRKVTAPAA